MIQVGDKFIKGSRTRTILKVAGEDFWWEETDSNLNYKSGTLHYSYILHDSFVSIHVNNGWVYIRGTQEEQEEII